MPHARFLDKTLLAVAHIARESLFSEQHARRRGLLQSLDVRVKLITFLFILVLISFLHAPQTLWILYLLTLALAFFSRVSPGFFLKRVWLFVPLFSAAIALPALFNIVTPGDPILVLLNLGRDHAFGPWTVPAEIAVTRQGLWGVIIFVSRVAVSVSFAVLFMLTTKWQEVFAGFRGIFAPRMFVMTLSMTYRYLFVLLQSIQDMYRARKSRTILPGSSSEARNWTATRIGTMFRKSMTMSEEIYQAMQSRGFQGEFRGLHRFRMTLSDCVWTIAVLSVGFLLILMEKGLAGS